jgi:predicted nucleic acid-binding protein
VDPARPIVIVVDTNVVTCLWLAGDHTPAAEALLAADPDWAVPLLWRSEFRNVLTSAVRRRVLTPARARSIGEAAEGQLGGREFAVETRHVLTLAARSGCSAYDCEFVALAEDLGVQLVSNDGAILRAFPGMAVPLGDAH